MKEVRVPQEPSVGSPAERDARYCVLLETAFDGLAIHAEGVILDINSAFANLLGYDAAELIGQSVIELAMPESRPDVAEALRTGRTEAYEVLARHRDGHAVPVEIRGRATTFNGRPARATAVRDLTERRMHEAALARQAAMLAKIEEREQLSRQFFNSVSHELRSPLTAVIGYSSILLQGLNEPLTEGQAKQMELVLKKARQLHRLVDDLMDCFRLEAGTFKLARLEADANVLVGETAESMRHQVEEAGLEFHVSLTPCPARVQVDAERLDQVVTNLIANAVRFTAVGRVDVTTQVGPDAFRCEVQDTGLGISDVDLPRLFQQYSQLHADVRPGGTGLGLAICKAIISSHGGEIGVVSQAGVGSTFWFTLPLGGA